MRKTNRTNQNRINTKKKPRKKGFWEGIKKKEEYSKFKTFKTGESKRNFRDQAEDMKDSVENKGLFAKKSGKNRRDGTTRIPKSVDRKSRSKSVREKFGRDSDPNRKYRNRKEFTKRKVEDEDGEKKDYDLKSFEIQCNICEKQFTFKAKKKPSRITLCPECFKKVND